MEETANTGGLKEFNYPKDYIFERTKTDEIRSAGIKEAYREREERRELFRKIRNGFIIFISIVIFILIYRLLK